MQRVDTIGGGGGRGSLTTCRIEPATGERFWWDGEETRRRNESRAAVLANDGSLWMVGLKDHEDTVDEEDEGFEGDGKGSEATKVFR
jgi:hypothetical protein